MSVKVVARSAMTPSAHPADPDFAADPAAPLAELRASCPVSRQSYGNYPDVTVVARSADVSDVFLDLATYKNVGTSFSETELSDVPMGLRKPIELNPPEHTDIRRMLVAVVSPRIVKSIEPELQTIIRRVTTEVAERSNADLMADWAVPIPALAIALLLGLPEKDMLHVVEWVSAQFSDAALAASAAAGTSVRSAMEVNDKFDGYLRKAFEARSATDSPPDDGMTRLLTFVPRSGREFSMEERCFQARMLLIAGVETTTSLLGNLVDQLIRNPEQLADLSLDRTLVGSAVEESLRHVPPLQYLNRVCAKPAVIGETPVEEGEVLSLSLASAGRDVEVWGEDAEDFILDRFAGDAASRRPHLAFGLGTHLCVGAPLARLEAVLAINALLDLLPGVAAAPDYESERIPFPQVRRPKRLPVVTGN
jgi:cytochrome P450